MTDSDEEIYILKILKKIPRSLSRDRRNLRRDIYYVSIPDLSNSRLPNAKM